MTDTSGSYVSRGGLKLEAALDAMGVGVADLVCADLGCSVGGFTDCLIQRGAERVHAVDTAYGQLAWTLRQHERVVVHERTNALHAEPAEPCDLVVVDLGWTVQARAVPAALRWLKPGDEGRVLTLIKPHYESGGRALKGGRKGKLSEDEAASVTRRVLSEMPGLGVTVLGEVASPVRGGKGGNVEHLALLHRA